MSMQNITVFKVPLWKNDYHRFCIQSEFTGWYGSGLWHELGTIEILVIPGQTSVRAGDMKLLSWREWWEDITELGWLTLCSPPQAENGRLLEDCPYWGGGCELFKDINNYAILASCWRSFSASLAWNSGTSVPFQHFPLIGVEIPCLAQRLKHLFHVLSLTNHAWWTWFFLISCVEAWLFSISFAMEVYQLA